MSSRPLRGSGSSFYFIALDLGPARDRNLKPAGGRGEWQVHGGGSITSKRSWCDLRPGWPTDLIWFKWESYSTLASGFALLFLSTTSGRITYLVDPSVQKLRTGRRWGFPGMSLGFGWLVYGSKILQKANSATTTRWLCRPVCDSSWGMGLFSIRQVFPGRAAPAASGGFHRDVIVGKRVSFSSFMRTSGSWCRPPRRGGCRDRNTARSPNSAARIITIVTYAGDLPVLSATIPTGICVGNELAESRQIDIYRERRSPIRHYLTACTARQGPTRRGHWAGHRAVVRSRSCGCRLRPVPQCRNPKEPLALALALCPRPKGSTVHASCVAGAACARRRTGGDGLALAAESVRLETETQNRQAAKRSLHGVTDAMPPAN